MKYYYAEYEAGYRRIQQHGGPHRRHVTPEMLRGELTRAGFHVESQDGRLGGDLICRPAATPKPSGQA